MLDNLDDKQNLFNEFAYDDDCDSYDDSYSDSSYDSEYDDGEW